MKALPGGILTVLAVAAVTLVAAEHLHLTSTAPSGTVTVDGRHDDWTGDLTPMGTDPFAVQIVNDQANLYLRLTASDPAVRNQIVRRGLIVWFDESGGTKKRLGIHYPVVEGGGPTGSPSHGGGYGGHRSGSGAPAAVPDDYEPSNRIDILGPGKDDARSLTLDHASGVEAALRVSEGAVALRVESTARGHVRPPVRRQFDRRQRRSGLDSRRPRSITRRPKLSMEAAVEVATGTAAVGWAGDEAAACTEAAVACTAAVRKAAAISRRSR